METDLKAFVEIYSNKYILYMYLMMSVQFYLLTACSKDRHVVSKNAKYNCIIARLDEI